MRSLHPNENQPDFGLVRCSITYGVWSFVGASLIEHRLRRACSLCPSSFITRLICFCVSRTDDVGDVGDEDDDETLDAPAVVTVDVGLGQTSGI